MGDKPENEYSRAQKDENDLFAAIGKKVLGLKISDEEKVDDDDQNEDERVKIVDEIESYCVNCEENVRTSFSLPSKCLVTDIVRVLRGCCSPKSPTFEKSSFPPFTATIVTSRIARSRQLVRFKSRDLSILLDSTAPKTCNAR